MLNYLNIIKELKRLLRKNLGDDIVEVILFGSHVKNKSHIDSDVDVLIIINYDRGYVYKRKIRNLCYDLSLKYDVLINSKIISVVDLNTPKGKHPIYQDAINEGIHA